MSQLDAAVQLKRESVKKSDARVVSSWLCSKSLRFKRLQLQVFGRKNVHGKKGLRLWIVLSVHQKNILSLLAGKIFQREKDFLPSKVKYIFRFNTRRCSNLQKFFSSRQSSILKKSKRDSLYFGWLPGPFKSATFFFFICTTIRK